VDVSAQNVTISGSIGNDRLVGATGNKPHPGAKLTQNGPR
jgi:hypothetical protein